MRKKYISLSLGLLLCLLLCGISVSAEEKVILSGDYSYAAVDGGIAIVKYKGSETELVIPDKIADKTVVAIRYDAFSDCKKLAGITIPATVTDLGESSSKKGVNAWGPAVAAINIAAGNPVYASSDGVLYYSDGLTLAAYPPAKTDASYAVPSGVINVWRWAFSGNTHLVSVSLPDSCVSLGAYAFSNCSALKTVTLSGRMTSIEEGLFSGCKSLFDTALPDSLISIASKAFADCSSLEYMGLPKQLSALGDSVFAGCSSLKVLSVASSLGLGGEDALAAAFTGFTGLTDSFRIYLSDRTECRINSQGRAEYVVKAEVTAAPAQTTAAVTTSPAQTTAAELLTLPETETVPEITSDPEPSDPVYDPARSYSRNTSPTLKVVGETTSRAATTTAKTTASTTKPQTTASQTTASQTIPAEPSTDETRQTGPEEESEAVTVDAKADGQASFEDNLTLVYILGAITFAGAAAAALYIFLKK